jgi:hypothetical protein
MSLLSRQSLQNKQCFHNLYAYLSAARNKFHVSEADISLPIVHQDVVGLNIYGSTLIRAFSVPQAVVSTSYLYVHNHPHVRLLGLRGPSLQHA